ncbi:MAG: ABC transporter permease subunit [Haliscomenobacter sp.]|nr:ABC transporter permease subunit [Haliscomenobacter sp.]
MGTLLRIELFKIATKPRSYIGFAAITVIVLLIELALWLDGRSYLEFILQALEQSFQVQGNLLNGNLVSFIILQTLIVQMPLLVALIAGDLVSGEAASGTIRLLLTQPHSRASILWAKYFATSIYVFLLIFWLGLLALGGGFLLFGAGDLVVLKSDELIILKAADTLWRFMAAFGIAFLSLSVVATFSLMLSCYTDNSIGPIIASMAVIILFTIIGTLEVPLFDRIKPFLFTTHMIVWRSMFDQPLDWGAILRSMWILVFHIALFLGVSFFHFTKKDIQN